jgi:hypothetical protein
MLRQPREAIIAPPNSGPHAPAMAVSALQIPIACARSFGCGYASRRMARDEGRNIAAPAPWRMRASTRVARPGANPQAAEAAVKTTRPVRKSRFAPSRSPRPPARSKRLAKVSVYPSMTQESPSTSVPRPAWMLGTATLTAVVSSSAMPRPKLVVTSVQRAWDAFRATGASCSTLWTRAVCIGIPLDWPCMDARRAYGDPAHLCF